MSMELGVQHVLGNTLMCDRVIGLLGKVDMVSR